MLVAGIAGISVQQGKLRRAAQEERERIAFAEKARQDSIANAEAEAQRQAREAEERRQAEEQRKAREEAARREAQEKAAGWPDRVTNQNRLDFAWAYVAADRAGKLKELGLDGMEFDEAVEALADTYDVLIKDNKPDAPLADARPE